MRVVDQQQPYAGQEVHRAVEGDVLGQQVGERGERRAAGLGGAGDPGAVRAAQRLGGQPGAAAARRSGDHQAGPAGRRRAADQVEFLLASGERPRQRPGWLKALGVAYGSRHIYGSPGTQP
jgi:hypothetical protein